MLLCSTRGKGARSKLSRRKSASVEYSQPTDFLVIFSRKENKREIIFKNFLKKKKKSMLPRQLRAGGNHKNLANLNTSFHRGETNGRTGISRRQGATQVSLPLLLVAL